MNEETLCFYDQNFIAQQPLNTGNIMLYFSMSPFYDRNCLNEILKMQSQFANIDVSHKLTTLAGFYYILEHDEQDLFIIAKKNNTGQKTTTVKMYYCMFGYVYAAPTVKALSKFRIVDTLWHLNQALDKYEELKKFDWLDGFQFRTDKDGEDIDLENSKFISETLHDFEQKIHPK